MERLNLKPTHKAVQNYYQALQEFESLGVSHEGAVRSAFQSLFAFLTLSGIPPEVFEYRLGNRSALDWIIDQYIKSAPTNAAASPTTPTAPTIRNTSSA